MNMQLNNLDDLVRDYGYPDALIDNHKLEQSGYAIWGFDEVLEYNNKGLYVNSSKVNQEPFTLLQSLIDRWIKRKKKIPAIGFLSYDIKHIIYPHINFKKIKNNFPYMWFATPKKIKSYKLSINDNTKKTGQHLSINQDILSSKEYEKKILLIKQELKKGNSYQINFTMPKLFNIKSHPFKIYLEIRKNIKPDFGYYLNIGDYHILSFSPEEFFHTKGNTIESYPMKGTKLRGSSVNEDKSFKKELKNSTKDKAEHVMIVDLLRNDIGKISQYGTVKVKNLFAVNSYPTVHQMVSGVYGKLKQNIKHVDILKALHPGGSITGAPKESSMKIIDWLEDYNRGIYTGTIGFINSSGNMCFNIAIRTLAINKQIATYGIGGGIVWKSNSEDERNEAELKSEILKDYIN